MSASSTEAPSPFAQLIQDHVHLPTALLESAAACGSIDTVWYKMLQDRAALVAKPEALLATQCYIDMIVAETRDEADSKQLSDILIIGRRLVERGLLDQCFGEQLIRNIECLPLSWTVSLIAKDLLQFSNLFNNECAVRNYLIPGILTLTKTADSYTSLQDLMGWIVLEAFPPSSWDTQMYTNVNTAQHLLNTLTTETYSEVWESAYHLLQAMGDCPALKQDTKDTLSSYLLREKITAPTSVTFESVLNFQEKWQYSALPLHIKRFYSAVCSLSENLLSILCSTIAYHRELNWTNVLSFLSTFLNSCQLINTEFRVALKDMLERSLTGKLQFLFRCTILFARQAALEGPHIHPSYEAWFKDMFGTGLNSVVKKKRDLQLFVKWLTELVPYEPSGAIKVHIQCLSLLKQSVPVTDYLALVKTRLSDLNVPLDTHQNTSSDVDHKEVKQAKMDVDKAVCVFAENQQVPDFLKTKHIFNKPYYLGRFLPYLLSPSTSDNSQKQNLINALARGKLIPPNMLSAYQKAALSLSKEEAPVGNECTSVTVELMTNALSVTSNLSNLAELSAHLSREMDDIVTHIDLQTPGLAASHVQVVDMFVSGVYQSVSGNQSMSLTQFAPLLCMLTQHTAFYRALFVRLWDLFHNQLHRLTDTHLRGLGVVCASLWLTQNLQLQHLTFDNTDLQTVSGLMDTLLANVPTPSQVPTLQALLMFCVHFLHFVLASLEPGDHSVEIAPPSLLTKVHYLCKRMDYIERSGEFDKCSQLIQELLDNEFISSQLPEVSIGDWLKWEVQCDSNSDYLTTDQRLLYMKGCLYTYYIPLHGRNAVFIKLFTCLASTCHCTSNYCQGVAILQEMSTGLTTSGQQPCLITAVEASMPKGTDQGDQPSSTFAKIISLICSLPVCLLVCNSLVQTSPPSGGEANSMLLKLKAMSSGFILPLSLTLHLCRLQPDLPLSEASLLCHWNKLLPTDQTAHIMQHAQWLHNEGGSLSEDSDPVILGVCIFHYINGSHANCGINDLKKYLQEMTTQLEAGKTEKLAVVMIDCCARTLAGRYFTTDRSHRLVDIAEVVLNSWPVSIVACVSHVQKALLHTKLLERCRTNFPSCDDTRLLPLILFRLLSVESSFSSIVQVSPSLLALVLSAHKETMELTGADQPQCLSIELAQEATRLTKLFIKSSPIAFQQETLSQAHYLLQPWLRRTEQ